MRMQSDSKWIDGRRTGSLFRKTVYFIYLTSFFRFFVVFCVFSCFFSVIPFKIQSILFFCLAPGKTDRQLFWAASAGTWKAHQSPYGAPLMHPFYQICNYPGDIFFAYSPATSFKYEILLRNLWLFKEFLGISQGDTTDILYIISWIDMNDEIG